MFERFTDRACKCMSLANQEAQRLNHDYVAPEHIMLGLIKEGTGVGANVLKNLEVDLRKARLAVEAVLKAGDKSPSMGKLPQTPRAKKVIEFAMEESKQLAHNYVGTEHLLLGLLHDGEVSKVLAAFGVTAEKVRANTLDLLGANDSPEVDKIQEAFRIVAGAPKPPIMLAVPADLSSELADRLCAMIRALVRP